MTATPISASARKALCAGETGNTDVGWLCSDILASPEWTDDGAVVLSDIPVTGLTVARRAVQTLSRALGTLLPQDAAGATLREVKYRGLSIGEGATGRYSDSREGRQWHTDGPHRPRRPPEIFALLCVRPARVGGALVLIDGERVVSALEQDTIEILGQRFFFDQREPDSAPVARQVLHRENGHWQFSYLRHYIELGHRHPHLPPLTGRQSAALDRLDATLDRLADSDGGHHRIMLRPGQLVIVDNRRMLHGRTEFTADPPDGGRLLLRTWIRCYAARSWPARLVG